MCVDVNGIDYKPFLDTHWDLEIYGEKREYYRTRLMAVPYKSSDEKPEFMVNGVTRNGFQIDTEPYLIVEELHESY